MKPRRSKPRRVEGRTGHGPGMTEARALTFARAGDRCEVQGPGCTGDAEIAHHRQTRRLGPDCPCNLLALCDHCHTVNVHSQPATAMGNGWIVSRHTTDPLQVQVRLDAVTDWAIFLNCAGTYLVTYGIRADSLETGEAKP